MGFTTFKFKFMGSKEQFLQKITNWVTNTEEGNKYQIKDSKYTLQKGGKPVIIKFSLREESPSLLDIMVIGFIKGDNPALALLIPCTCWIGEYPGFTPNKTLRSNHKGDRGSGWEDIIDLFAFLEITDYQIEEIEDNALKRILLFSAPLLLFLLFFLFLLILSF
ncbi:MAG: hypothetical protein ACW964_17745 [Candidatus Hodarchaeales archaeon]|jgi:hypothetical protein